MRDKQEVAGRLARVERDMAEMGVGDQEYGEMEAMAIALRWVLDQGNSDFHAKNIWRTEK